VGPIPPGLWEGKPSFPSPLAFLGSVILEVFLGWVQWLVAVNSATGKVEIRFMEVLGKPG
jgi:hypothetical protein